MRQREYVGGQRAPRWLLGLAIAAAFACAPTEPVDDQRCLQATREFAHYGCVVVAGRVVGTNAAPLEGISVGPSASLDGAEFNTPNALTDTQGAFVLRMARFLPSAGATDSVSLWIRARTIPAVGGTTIGDSVLVRARVAGINSPLDTATVEIVLAVP